MMNVDEHAAPLRAHMPERRVSKRHVGEGLQ